LNVGEWIQKRALVYPRNLFLQDGEKVFNNRQFNERVNRTANALGCLGVVSGDRVALLMPNCSEFLEVFFACAKTGAIMVPLNFRLTGSELSLIVRDAEPRAFIYAAEFDAQVRDIKTTNCGIQKYLRHGTDGFSEDLAFSDYICTQADTEPAPRRDIDLKDPLLIMYTAGTTGDPKGAVLTHENVLFGAIHSLLGYGVNRSYKSLVVAPLFHIAALAASVIPVIYAGGSIVISSFYNAADILRTISSEKINYMFAVPVMFQLITEAEEWKNVDLSHVHFFISGGAPIPLAVIRKYQEEKGVGFAQGYALTETGRLTSLDLEDSIRKAGSVGKEVFHVSLRIVDEQGKDLPPEEPGEIIVRGPNVFAGYWRREEATRTAFQDGWFHTGDMGRRDEDGFVYIIGRKLEMIISSGENIYPAEVERAIQSLPEVSEAAVVGIPDGKRGEVVAAFVLLHPGRQINEQGLSTALQPKIALYKIPRKVIFVENFPRNAAGKILKGVLLKRLQNQTADS
jgi:fatty-acyl-CoA synthase